MCVCLDNGEEMGKYEVYAPDTSLHAANEYIHKYVTVQLDKGLRYEHSWYINLVLGKCQ